MAKVKKFSTHYSKPAGGMDVLNGDINVDSEGIFYFKFKEPQLPFVERYIQDNSGRAVYIGGKKRDNLYSSSMMTLEGALKSICRLMAESGKKEELIIMYQIEKNVAYFRTHEGVITANAAMYDREDVMEIGTWYGKTSSIDKVLSYSVNVYAKVVNRITQTGSTTVKYESPYHMESMSINHFDGEGDPHEFLVKLDSFSLPYPSEDGFRSDSVNPADLKEMPYTEQRAKFFYELLLGMCKLADKFTILDDEETVLKLADSGKGLLMAPPDEKKKK